MEIQITSVPNAVLNPLLESKSSRAVQSLPGVSLEETALQQGRDAVLFGSKLPEEPARLLALLVRLERSSQTDTQRSSLLASLRNIALELDQLDTDENSAGNNRRKDADGGRSPPENKAGTPTRPETSQQKSTTQTTVVETNPRIPQKESMPGDVSQPVPASTGEQKQAEALLQKLLPQLVRLLGKNETNAAVIKLLTQYLDTPETLAQSTATSEDPETTPQTARQPQTNADSATKPPQRTEIASAQAKTFESGLAKNQPDTGSATMPFLRESIRALIQLLKLPETPTQTSVQVTNQPALREEAVLLSKAAIPADAATGKGESLKAPGGQQLSGLDTQAWSGVLPLKLQGQYVPAWIELEWENEGRNAEEEQQQHPLRLSLELETEQLGRIAFRLAWFPDDTAPQRRALAGTILFERSDILPLASSEIAELQRRLALAGMDNASLQLRGMYDDA